MDPVSPLPSFDPARIHAVERTRRPRRRGSREDEYNPSSRRRQSAQEEQPDRFEPSFKPADE